MRSAGQRGASLTEALVSLALAGIVLGAALPAVLAARRAGIEGGRRAALADGGRLAALALGRDLRRAGFGLGEALPALGLEADGLLIRYLQGGFAGGSLLTAPAAAGARSLRVAEPGMFDAGDTVLLRDRHGGSGPHRVAARDTAAAELTLEEAVERPWLPADGARVYLLVERRWWRDGDLLRRDGQPALSGVTALEAATWPVASGIEALDWLMLLDTAPAAGKALAGARLSLVSTGARGEWTVALAAEPADAGAAGSPLP